MYTTTRLEAVVKIESCTHLAHLLHKERLELRLGRLAVVQTEVVAGLEVDCGRAVLNVLRLLGGNMQFCLFIYCRYRVYMIVFITKGNQLKILKVFHICP